MPRIRVLGLVPERTWARPGSRASLSATIASDRAAEVRLELELLDVDAVVRRVAKRSRVQAGATLVRLGVSLPDAPRHGYGLRLTVRSRAGAVLDRATEAIEALAGWWESPRHVALVDHTDAGTRHVPALRAWHVTVAQAYDWMWRHYRYEPPHREDPFRDTLGRPVSHRSLRATIGAARRAGIATLAYGSVYGAELEHVLSHPADRVFDDRGEPLSLGGTFFINDLRPGSAWRGRLLGEYRGAMRRFRFAGIHMDTYGPPYAGVGADGGAIVFRELYPGLIADAAEAVSHYRDGRVLFNCVEGYPLEDVAAAPMAALYLELWPPDDRFRHLVDWIDRARALAEGRQVVIAAYGGAMRDARSPAERAAAIEATLLATSVIGAAGAYHHTLAEDDRLLVEGYYPAAVPLRRAEAEALRAAWRFGARYLHLLSGPAPDPVLGASVVLHDAAGTPIPASTVPKAGAVWVRATRTAAGAPVIHLVDLRMQPDDRWDAGKVPTPTVSGWRLGGVGLHHPIAAGPWIADGDPMRPTRVGTAWQLPRGRRWLLVSESAVDTAP